MSDLEFLVGLLDRHDSASVALEDFDGPHGKALRLWQRLGFLSREPGMNPAPSCPECGEGVPYQLEQRWLCNNCCSTVDARHLLLWPLDLEAFLRWLAAQWQLRGGVRQIGSCLWELGTGMAKAEGYACFYRRSGTLKAAAIQKLQVYRNILLLHGATSAPPAESCTAVVVPLLEVLQLGRSMTVAPWPPLRRQGQVRFDAQSGTLWAGDVCLGDVPLGSKEYHFLACLAAHLGRLVGYADLKHMVLRQSGSTETTEEATFCHGLKRRVKKHIPQIDLLMTTTNKGDGYRLRAWVGPHDGISGL